jgi:hypothetical protein
MATTTNYSWTTPDDTALVKDGAAAIRTLGSSVDTTVKNLNPETTLGDLAYRSSTANVKTRLGLGTAGQVLQVNSGATAPEWATPTSGGMTLISTTTLSGASIVLSSIPATYNKLYLVIRNLLPATDSGNFNLRLNGDSGANRYKDRSWVDAGSTTTFDATQFFSLSQSIDNAVSTNLYVIQFFDYTNTTTWKYGISQCLSVNSTTNTEVRFDAKHHLYNQTAAISSITLYMNSGNLTSGTALLYGVK